MAAPRPSVNHGRFVAADRCLAGSLLVAHAKAGIVPWMSENTDTTATGVALERLERALDRVERAAVAHGEVLDAHARLESRHDLLRTRIQATIADLDALIAGAPEASAR